VGRTRLIITPLDTSAPPEKEFCCLRLLSWACFRRRFSISPTGMHWTNRHRGRKPGFANYSGVQSRLGVGLMSSEAPRSAGASIALSEHWDSFADAFCSTVERFVQRASHQPRLFAINQQERW
jgi:hypothetical protein